MSGLRDIKNRNIDTPPYKVSGLVRDGRWDLDNEDWVIARITPRYFRSLGYALEFFDSNSISVGTLWKLVSSMSTEELKYDTQKYKPKGAYGIIKMKNMTWPKGVRAGNNKYTPREELARADPNNFRHGDKYPSRKYSSWRSEGRKKK